MGYQWGEQERGVDKRPNQIYGKPEGFEANCKRIETHKVRPFLEDTSSGKVSVAFLARAPYKFTEKLFEEDAQTRRETLKSMSRWLIAHPKNKVSQSELDCIQILTQLLSDKDVVIREHAALVLSLLASVMEGVDKMLQVGTIKQLLVVMQDVASLKARSYAHKCLQLIGNLPEGSQAMVDAGGTAMLVAVCKHSPTADAVLSLKCCLQCMQGLSDALECRAIGAMASCVSSEDPAILQHALKNITYLTLSQAAKLEAIAEVCLSRSSPRVRQLTWCQGCMPRIVQLVLHDIALVRASAIAAVASIAVAVEVTAASPGRGSSNDAAGEEARLRAGGCQEPRWSPV
eukprot:767322-Hanusia_phi.AAC.1